MTVTPCRHNGGMVRPTPIERFESKLRQSDTGCWEWTAGKTRGGYGKFKVEGQTLVAHRWYFQQVRHPVPRDLQLDHLCRNPACCNPDHLEPVTCRVNLLRGRTFQAENAAKTHCPLGHPLDGDNLLLSGGSRSCRTCKRAQTAAWRAANLEAARERDAEAARRRRAERNTRAATG